MEYKEHQINSAEKYAIHVLEVCANTKMDYVKTICGLEPHASLLKKYLNEAGYKFTYDCECFTIQAN